MFLKQRGFFAFPINIYKLIKQDINYKVINLERFSIEMDIEICCVQLIEQNMYIVSLYRSPQGNIDSFFHNFEQAMKELLIKNAMVAICGDFNIEMTALRSQNSIYFSNLLKSLNLNCTVKTPTHINSCIDNILVNFTNNLYYISSLEGHFADHISHVMQVYRDHRGEPSKNYNSGCNKILIRKQTENQINLFINLLKYEKWEMINRFNSGMITVDVLFDNFFKHFVNLWHYCSPLVSKSNKCRVKKKKVQWYNQDLAKEKDYMLSLYNVYKNLRDSRSEHALLAYNTYLGCKRNYRSELKRAKRQACESYIEAAPNKCKAAWEIIKQENSSGNSQAVTLDPKRINDFFLNSVHQLSNSIPPTNTSYYDLLGDRSVPSETFFLANS
uniref:Endonuclease/exonuclease/phosphatase domain-containing protein n=1 Tax=Homalodisca liturata TaxID=320908 RepID=A0A1B6IZR3_9HEMI